MVEFHNTGYTGLYNGETADDIFERKKLRYKEDILDNMNEDELVANLFIINQTKQKLLKDDVQGEKKVKSAKEQINGKAIIISADTIVCDNDKIYEKSQTKEEASIFLKEL